MLGSTFLFVCLLGGPPGMGVCTDLGDHLHHTASRSATYRTATYRDGSRDAVQDPGNDELLAALREQLRLPGREGADKRQAAVVQLLSLVDPAAHALLREHMQRIDEDSVAQSIVEHLGQALANAQHPVFSPSAPARDLRTSLLETYVVPLARLWLLAIDSEQPVPDADRRAMRAAVRSAVRRLPPRERRAGLAAALASTDTAERIAAIRLIPECADLDLAPLLAGLLGEVDHGELARESLFELTFRNFATKAEFDAWYPQAPASYRELTEQAARRSLQTTAKLRREFTDQLNRVNLALIEAYVVTSREVQWQLLQPLLAPGPGELFTAGLDKLREILVAEPGYTASGRDVERLALLTELTERYDELSKRGNGIAKRAPLLEVCAYLTGNGEAELREAMKTRLKLALDETPVRLRVAAVRGLARYPGPDSLQELLVAGRKASGTEPEIPLLEACLQTLGQWDAPTGDAAQTEWVGLIEQTLLDPRLPSGLHRSALRVLLQKDEQKLRPQRAFELLDRVAADSDLDPSLRTLALSRMVSFAGDGGGEAARAHTLAFLGRLGGCLKEQEPEQVRLAAAELVKKIPTGTNLSQASTLLAMAQTSVRQEKSEAVLRALVDSLKQLAPRFPHELIVRFSSVAERFAQEPPEPFRREIVVDALKLLAMGHDREARSWVHAGNSLLGIGERDALRQVLARQFPRLAKPGLDEQLRRSGLGLVVEAARLKPANVSWAQLPEEAKDVLEAMDGLEKAKALSTEPEIAVLRIEVLVGLRQYSPAETRIRALGDTLLTEVLTRRLALAAGETFLRLNQVADAVRYVGPGRGNGGGEGPTARLLALQHELAQAQLDAKPADAVQLIEHVLRYTPVTAGEHLSRALLLAKARLRADPGSAAEVRKLLESKRALVAKATAEVQAAFAELLKECAGTDD